MDKSVREELLGAKEETNNHTNLNNITREYGTSGLLRCIEVETRSNFNAEW